MAKFLVAGSRERWAPFSMIDNAIDLLKPHGVTSLKIISGTAVGVDKSGEAWAEKNYVEVERYPADWGQFGRKAGHIRNAQMADIPPDFAFILWDGTSKGTQGMIRLLAQRQIPHLAIIDYEGEYYYNPKEYRGNTQR